jgi:outer membrane protein
VSRDAVAQAEENLALFRIRYDSGAATTLELLDAESQLVRTRSSELTSRYGVLRAEAALSLATGG